MSQISRASQIGNFLDSYCKTHAYFLPGWVPSQIRNFYYPLPFHNAVPERLKIPVQWLKMQSVMKALDDALVVGGHNSMPPRVWTCLRHAPAILFFVPRGNLSKYKIVKPATFLRDHWPKVSLVIQAFATLSLLAAGRRLQAGGMLIGISAHAVLMMDVVPDKVKSVITIVDQFVQSLYFYGPGLLKPKKDPLDLLALAYSVYSTVSSLYELLPKEPPVPPPDPKIEPVARYDQIRFSDLIVNPNFDPKTKWERTIDQIGRDRFNFYLSGLDEIFITSDRHYLELAAVFWVIKQKVDESFTPPAEELEGSAKELCEVWEKDVYTALETLEKAHPEKHLLYTTAAWLISYQMHDLSQIATGYLNEQLKGSVEEQLKACWKVPSENLAYALLTRVPQFADSQPIDPNQLTTEKAIQQMEIISKGRQQQKALELIQMGILQQKQPVKPTT